MLNKNLKQSGPKSKLVLSVAVVIIASMAIYNWVLSPQTAYLYAAQQYEQIAKDAKNKIKILEKTIERKQNKLKQDENDYKDLKSRFFSKTEAAEFLAGIEPLARKAGCVVESVGFLPSEDVDRGQVFFTGKVSARRAVIGVKGQYDSITKLIQYLTGLQKNVVVSNLDLQLEADFSALTCDMNVKIYIFEDKEIN